MLFKKDKQLLIEQKFLDTKFNFKNSKLKASPFNKIIFGESFEDNVFILKAVVDSIIYKNKILKLKNKYQNFYDSYDIDESDLDITVSKKENAAVFLSDAIDAKQKEIHVFGKVFDEPVKIDRNKNKFFEKVNENVSYSLRPSKLSSKNMVIERNDKKVAVLKLEKDYFLQIKGDNLTDIALVGQGSATFVYRKSYFEKLNGKEPDVDKSIAFIQWDILEEDNMNFLSALYFYNIDYDKDAELFALIFLLAIAPGLIFKNMIASSRMMTMGAALIGARTATMMRH